MAYSDDGTAALPLHKRIWKRYGWAITLFVLLRLAFLLLAIVNSGVSPEAGTSGNFFQRYVIQPWNQWDVEYFLRIAAQGYRADDGTAQFHPLYPLLGRAAGWLLGGDFLLGLLLVGGLWWFWPERVPESARASERLASAPGEPSLRLEEKGSTRLPRPLETTRGAEPLNTIAGTTNPAPAEPRTAPTTIPTLGTGTRRPGSTPAPSPTPAAMAAGIGTPCRLIRLATTVPVRPATAPCERSNPPPISGKAWPMARMPVIATASSTLKPLQGSACGRRRLSGFQRVSSE